MFVSQPHSPSTLDGSHLRIGVVQARFNDGITNALAQACLEELAAMGVVLKDNKDGTTSWELKR